MADEYISKQAFNDAIREAVRKYPNTFYNGLEVARQIAHDMDAADVQPVIHGRWLDISDIDHESKSCSSCGFNATGLLAKRCNYCPNCGADMREAKHERP